MIRTQKGSTKKGTGVLKIIRFYFYNKWIFSAISPERKREKYPRVENIVLRSSPPLQLLQTKRREESAEEAALRGFGGPASLLLPCAALRNISQKFRSTVSRHSIEIQGRKMVSACRFSVLLMLIAVTCGLTIVTSSMDEFLQCKSVVKDWAASAIANGVKGDNLKLRDLLFFLHVPRTGGRTYFQCFLRKLYTSDLECPRSYDKLRFNPSNPNCRLMATHDDYSVMSKLPKESTSVVTILRNPIDRVLSSYEFSVEVAARFLVHPNLTSATQMTGRLRSKARGVSTLEIWPWKYLVPWMREDLFGRREGRKLGKVTGITKSSNPYDMKDIVIPLQAFIDDPLAHEIVHNGATFQVAGLTNNSCLVESHKVRYCVKKYSLLGEHVLGVAKKRLDDMLYIGLTEYHKESAEMFANMVGVQVLSLLEALSSNTNQVVINRAEQSSSVPEFRHENSGQLQNSIDVQKPRESRSERPVEIANENITVAKLMGSYEACMSNLRKAQAGRRVSSLKRISPVNFTMKARLQIPEVVRRKILSLNSLDVELYKHAQNIFAQQQRHLIRKWDEVEMQDEKKSNSPGCYSWRVLVLSSTILFSVPIVFMFVASKRRTSKLKV